MERPAPQIAPEAVAAVPAQTPATNLARAAALEGPPPVPRLAVEQIIWHPRPERRVAIVVVSGESEPRRLAEGDIVAGHTVKKIGISKLELTRDGVATERRVGD